MAPYNSHRWKRRCQGWLAAMPSNLSQNHLWQRMLKNTICTGTAVIIGLIPAVISVYGKSTYLAAMATVFGHPGQRFGQMMETLTLILIGTIIGLAWSLLGLYLSSLIMEINVNGAYAVKAIFFGLVLLFHGLLRSSVPRLFQLVFWLVLISTSVLTGTSASVSTSMVTGVLYPVMTGLGMTLLVNITIFPEFSSDFLGNTTIQTLSETVRCLQEAGRWFLADSKDTCANSKNGAAPELQSELASLTEKKSKLRAKLTACKKAQVECNFEVVLAVLPPRSLKSVSSVSMERLVQNVIFLINACESKYAMVGEHSDPSDGEDRKGTDDDSESDSESDSDSSSDSSSDSNSDAEARTPKSKKPKKKSRHQRNVDLVKPVREVESGDIDLLEHILCQVRTPAKSLQGRIQEALHVITLALGYCYDVSKLPSGGRPPRGVPLEEMDVFIDAFSRSMETFDSETAQALEQAASMAYGKDLQADIMPRMETFLISSFLITLREAANQVQVILKRCRKLIEWRQSMNEQRRLYIPKFFGWGKWLRSDGELDGLSLPAEARKELRTGRGNREEDPRDEDDDECDHDNKKKDDGTARPGCQDPEKQDMPERKSFHASKDTRILWFRGLASDTIDFFADSDDLAFALKLCFAAFTVTWPAFVPAFHAWYSSMRGSWATVQLILVFEVSIGTSFMGFMWRIWGVIYGCVVGFLAYEIGQGNRIAGVVVIIVGSIPANYTQLGTPWVKTGVISLTTMSVVGLSTVMQLESPPWSLFVKRLVCFIIGGVVALLVEMIIFPVRARDRLVECLASSVQQLGNMETSVAVGIDDSQKIDLHSPALNANFNRAKGKAEAALTAAETFLPFTLTEPRLKGSFKGQALIYNEMIYVLYQIIDRMDNMLRMRKSYGNRVLEEMQEKILPYRRNVAASITLILFAIHEALTTRLPLPQFLPSARVAQLRYVSRVRELMLEPSESLYTGGSSAASTIALSTALVSRPRLSAMVHSRQGSIVAPLSSTPLESHVLKSVTQQNFMSWSSASCEMMEICEYLEEIIDLTKLLVGVNAFRSGVLVRPRFMDYLANNKWGEDGASSPGAAKKSAAAEMERETQRIRDRGGDVMRRRGCSVASDEKPSEKTTGMGGILRKRQTFGVRADGASSSDAVTESGVTSDDEKELDQLPMSLQRVRTRRMEEWRTERGRTLRPADPKGKGLKQAETWMA